MGKNKIMTEPPVLSDDDIAIGELMLFSDSVEEMLPKQQNGSKKTKLQVTPINTTNHVDVENVMLYSISKMSLFAQKLFYTAISEIQPEDKEFKEVIFKATDIAKKFNMKQQNVSSGLYQATSDLLESQLLVWDDLKKDFMQVNIYSTKFMPKEEGIVVLKFNEDMKKYLLGLKKHFSKVPLKYLLDLPTTNAMKLFHIFYGQLYTNIKYHKNGKLKISYRQLRAMFEPEMFYNYGRKRKWENPQYPTFKDFNRNVLKPAVLAINKQGIIHVEIEQTRGEPDKYKEENNKLFFFESSSPVNARKISHLVFTVTKGENFDIEEEKRKNQNAEDALLREICAYFKARFDISDVVVKKLLREGYSYTELMLSAISMQSILNFSSRGLWIYTKDKANWSDLTFRKEHYIKEYLKISLPNLGTFFDEEEKFHQLVIKEPVGFLKSTLKDKLYLQTIDLINKQGTLTAFTSSTNEKLCVASLYDNAEYGESFKNCIKGFNNKKSAVGYGKEFDLIYKIFSSFCRDSALKLNPNTKWRGYFYSGFNEVDVYWKIKFYKQKPERQESIKKTVNRILAERNLL